MNFLITFAVASVAWQSHGKNGRIAMPRSITRRGAGVADQGRLLSDCSENIGTVGSNPTLSASATNSKSPHFLTF